MDESLVCTQEGFPMPEAEDFKVTIFPAPQEGAVPVLLATQPDLPAKLDTDWIRAKHTQDGDFWEQGKSFFYDDVTEEDFQLMLDIARDVIPRRQSHGNWVWTAEYYNIGTIGEDEQGVPSSEFSIILDPQGNLTSMIVGRPSDG